MNSSDALVAPVTSSLTTRVGHRIESARTIGGRRHRGKLGDRRPEGQEADEEREEGSQRDARRSPKLQRRDAGHVHTSTKGGAAADGERARWALIVRLPFYCRTVAAARTANSRTLRRLMTNRPAARPSRAEARRRARMAAQGQAADSEFEGSEVSEPAARPATGGSLLQTLVPPAPPLRDKGDPLAGFTYGGPARRLVAALWLLARHPLAWLVPALIWMNAPPFTSGTV